MIATELEKNFGKNTPILLDEIKRLFSQYSTVYLFQLLRDCIAKGELVRYDDSVYFVPKQSIFGEPIISTDEVVYKKYIKTGNEVQGTLIGWSFLNRVGATTQVPNVIEIATNKESMRVRTVTIGNRKFILRKPRVEIDKDNEKIVSLMETATWFEFGQDSTEALIDYAKQNKITVKDILVYAEYYPAQTLKNMTGVLYGLAS